MTALAILCLNLLDAFLTLVHVAAGAEEQNPFMAFFLGAGPLTFLVVKYALAGVGLVGILFFDPHRVARLALRWILLPTYLAIVAYQVALFFLSRRCPG